ncbi:MAG: exo-alpha-sialidase [Verrucomicrobia bacterium]|nr:exo-alpha-sialidase [Verrucomicrobiota bacterium]
MKILSCIVALLCLSRALSANELTQTDIFVGGVDGYHTYRIPSLIVTKKGTILAFCEARKSSKSDTGNIDLVFKRSKDGGTTWSPQQVVWDDGDNTCGNPCPVVDEKTGTIWLLLTHNLGNDHEKDIKSKKAKSTRTVWVCNSTDDGKTWSKPVEITRDVKDPSWGWYATGPGVGIQIKHGPYKGRLVIPCDHSFDEPTGGSRGLPIEYAAHSIYSDDHGKTWKLGGVITPRMNECQLVELADKKGTLLMDMRAYTGRSRRNHSISADGGVTWSKSVDHPELIEPVCQASILRYTWPGRNEKSRILFSNPADEKKRVNMTVRMSYDEGKTWPVAKALHSGATAYSSLAILRDQTIACLYERGDANSYEKITFARFTLDWLTEGNDSVQARQSRGFIGRR